MAAGRASGQVARQLDARSRLQDRPTEADTVHIVASTDDRLTVVSNDVDAAIATATAIESKQLEDARLDERWRDFCLDAERYVAEANGTSTLADGTVGQRC